MIEQICFLCGQQFTIVESQFRYQIKKDPQRKWFCGKSCCAKYRNSIYKNGTKHLQLNQRENSLRGAVKNQKYDPNFVWYISRCKFDHRKDKRITKANAGKLLAELWNNQKGMCAITGVDLIRRTRSNVRDLLDPWQIASIDRIDSSKPYSYDNMQWVSLAVNLAKNKYKQENFLAGLENAAKKFLEMVEARGQRSANF